MDIVGTLASRLNLPPEQAQAVVGAVLGAARTQVPDAETARIDSGVPELSGWMKAAESVLAQPAAPSAGGGLLGGLMEAAGSGLGNQLLGAIAGQEASQAASAVAVLGRLGIQPQHAALVATLVIDFLTARVGAEWTQRIVAAAPALATAAPGLESLVEGLFKPS